MSKDWALKPASQQATPMQACGSMHVPVHAVKDEDMQSQEHSLSLVPSQFLKQASSVSTPTGVFILLRTFSVYEGSQ